MPEAATPCLQACHLTQVLALHARGQLTRNSASDNPGRLVPQGDWKELNFIFKGVPMHYMRAACALHVHRPHFILGHAYTLRMRLPPPPPSPPLHPPRHMEPTGYGAAAWDLQGGDLSA